MRSVAAQEEDISTKSLLPALVEKRTPMRGFKIRMLLSRIEKTKQFDEEVSLLLTYLSERWETSRLRRSPGRSLQKEGIRRWIVEYHEANFEDDPNDLFQAPADRNASSLDSDKDSPSWSRPRM